ncbi:MULTISPECIES: hypothetical protein [Pseudoalteromonas]|uniref:Uncharacterized protein n=1 Tax=Pseudoalteromonas fuliginea TaxID=1872678 RepID=A0A833AK03_9GAMM|nr:MULTISPECIES: hypothetical protein [Pseudoalteromonas]KAA1163557.1 hypothetical protein EU509_03430 [Pseudoalteromonas fuliginea]KAA1165821.1 hypothetical protein EU508_00385 [Pseudoalteromonas fuliginea]KAA1168854.1 hypothetical protein EUZ79_03825 [Pseudoalteromonas fuliginea]MDQ2046020.1 hypothetical protein [Pseudoalteromonas sp. 20-92]GAA80576.1 hypothetical protein P20495_3091 [Pseudoalteromonas sp. BSi20495]
MNQFSTIKKMLLGVVLASSSVTASEIPAHVITAYQQGLTGSQEQNQLAVNALSELNNKASNPVVLAMLGSAETTQARYTSQPWQKMKFAEAGIAKLNKAIKQVKGMPYPLKASVYVTAGCTFAQVPKMMNRAEHGAHLLNQVLADSDGFSKLDKQLKQSTYRCAALAANKLEDQTRAKLFIEKSDALARLSKAEKG